MQLGTHKLVIAFVKMPLHGMHSQESSLGPHICVEYTKILPLQAHTGCKNEKDFSENYIPTTSYLNKKWIACTGHTSLPCMLQWPDNVIVTLWSNPGFCLKSSSSTFVNQLVDFKTFHEGKQPEQFLLCPVLLMPLCNQALCEWRDTSWYPI